MAAVGIFALVSYSVSQRQHEFGIRSAIGAGANDIVLLAVRQGLVLTATGIPVGLSLAFVLTRFLTGLLVGVSPTDPLVLATTVAILTIVALGASWVPSRRAAASDPLSAIRTE